MASKQRPNKGWTGSVKTRQRDKTKSHVRGYKRLILRIEKSRGKRRKTAKLAAQRE